MSSILCPRETPVREDTKKVQTAHPWQALTSLPSCKMHPQKRLSVAREARLAATNNRKRLELPDTAGEKRPGRPSRDGTHLLYPQPSNPTPRHLRPEKCIQVPGCCTT